jgi:DNA-binding NarL/FixJ family response regulator
MLRQLLVEALTSRGLEVTGQAANAVELLGLVAAQPPDVVVADIRMPPSYQDEGLRAAERIRSGYPDVGVLVLSHYAETSYAIRLLEGLTGRVGYLVKDRVQDTDRLVDTIRRVAGGEVVVDPEVIRRVMLRSRTVDPLQRLTPSEREVLALIAEGLSNAAIARRLSYSVKTVEKRVTAIAQKLGLREIDGNVRVLAVLAYLRGC